MTGIRQVALLSGDLEADVALAEEALASTVVHRDRNMAQFGLRNAVVPMGADYLELVAPTDPDCSAARRLTARGPGFYMAIVEVDPPLAAHRNRLNALGCRVVAELADPGWASLQLHPADTGCTLLSLDVVEPGWSWPPVGARAPHPSGGVDGIAGLTIECTNPDALSLHWSKIFGVTPSAPLNLGASWAKFGRSTTGTSDVIGVALRPGPQAPPSEFTLCGVNFSAVDAIEPSGRR